MTHSKVVSCTVIAGLAIGVGCHGVQDLNSTNAAIRQSPQFLGVVEVIRQPKLGTILRLKGKNLSKRLEQEGSYGSLQAAGAYADMALVFVTSHRDEFRLHEPALELQLTRVQSDELGYHQVRLHQVYRGLEVAEAEIIVHFDPDDHIYLVQGHYAPTPIELPLTPKLSKDEILATVPKAVGTHFSLNEPSLAIFIYRDRLYLAYRVVASRAFYESWELFVDAHTGAILRKASIAYHGEES